MQFGDDNGNPLSGGRLFTYAAGTNTPKATYTTAAATVANANPIVLDSAGRAVAFLDGSYKFRLETAASVLVRETDNVSAFTTSAVTIDSILPAQSGNAGKFLTTNGVNASWAVAQKQLKVQTFLSSTTWTCPAGVTKIYFDGCGGGGGAGGGATTAPGGGGGGAQAVKGTELTVVPSTVYTVTIGAGGTGATGSGNNGTAGGSTSLVSLITLAGGGGGGGNTAGAAGGASGGAGGGVGASGAASANSGGGGAGCLFGAGGPCQASGSLAGVNGSGYGSGGGSSQNNTQKSGDGAGGMISIMYLE
jgi:hypothetical protein